MTQQRSTYFDYNATTPLSYKAAEAMEATLGFFANASSNNRDGIANKKLVKDSKNHVAHLLGTTADKVFFTSGGSESNNWAIKGVLLAQVAQPGHIISSAIEHPSVLETLKYCANTFGFRLTLLKPRSNGAIALEDFTAALTEDTQLVSMMYANNETGVLQPIEAIAKITRKRAIPLHVDAVQVVGKRMIDVSALGVDFLSFSSHKFYGPKGIGGLYIHDSQHMTPLIHGGGQEFGMRSGTENVLAIAGLSVAAQEAHQQVHQWDTRYWEYKQYLMNALNKSTMAVRFNGETDYTAAMSNTLNLEIIGVRAEAVAALMENKYGFIIALGSACSNNKQKQLSHVLQAMGLSEATIQSSIRISFGCFTQRHDIEHFVQALESCVNQLLRISTVTAA